MVGYFKLEKMKKKFFGLLIAIFAILMCLSSRSVHAESTGFSRIDGGTSNGIIGSTAVEDLDRISTASIGNDLYAAWIDTKSTSFFELHVQKYDGNTKTWSYIDGSNGYKNRTSFNADFPSLYVYNNKLYLSWVEGTYVYMEQYDPMNNTWTVIDNGGITSGSGGSTGNPSLCFYNGKLYLSYYQGDSNSIGQIRVERYDGDFLYSNTWTVVDLGSGLNYNTSKNAIGPRMAVYKSSLMVVWNEYNSSNVMQVRAKIYDEHNWSNADGGATETPEMGINGDSTKNAYCYGSMVNCGGYIYLSWYNQNNKIVTKKYNGSWSDVPDVPDVTDTYATRPNLYTDGTNLYMSFMDGLNGTNGINLKKFDGTSWTSADGNHTVGIKADSSGASYSGQVQVISGIPYVIYEGTCTGVNGTKIYAARYMPSTLTAASPLAERHLDSQSFTVTLVNDTFKDSTLDAANFQIVNAPDGLSIEKVTWVDNKTCTVDLAFSGDLKSYTNSGIGLKISADELSYGADVYNIEDLPITHAGNSYLSNSTVNIQKHENASDYSDKDISINLNGNSFDSITDLTEGTDYVIKDSSTITLKKSYLAALPIGKMKIPFHFDYGTDPVLEINVNNLAYGKTISSSCADTEYYKAGYAVDGDKSTAWDNVDSSYNALPFPQYVIVDLGSEYTVSSWAINTDDSNGCTAATVYGKIDKTEADFEEIGSFTENSSSYISKSLATPKKYRYIKLQVDAGDSYGCKCANISEFEVFGLIPSTTATVTSESYTVSTGGTASETITNVPYGTSKSAFEAALAKGNANQSWDESGLSDPIANGNTLVVTAEDGTTKVTYTVTVGSDTRSSAKAITSFSIGSETGTIDETNHTIGITVPYGTAVTSLKPTIVVSDKAAVSPASGAAKDLTSPVNYTVTAENGTTQNYTVTVTVGSAPKSTIATVTSGTYTVSTGGTENETITNVPYGTSKSDFEAALAKGDSKQTWDGAALSDPVVTGNKIVVTAEDGKAKVTYTVTVNAAIAAAPTIVVQPESKEVTVGQNVSFSISAIGDAPLSYQWQKDGTAINNATGSAISLTNVQLSDAGNYTVTVSNTIGSTTSSAARLTVNTVSKGGSSDDNTPSGGSSGNTSNVTPNSATTTVKGSVVEGSTGNQVSGVSATVTTDNNGNKAVSMKASDIVALKQSDGSINKLEDVSKIKIYAENGSAVAVASDGTVKVENLAKGTDNNFKISYDLGNGEKIVIGHVEVKVDNNGEVSLTCELIDPYGVITDVTTGKPVQGATVTLYYADTERNKKAGKIPGTIVELPAISGFKPNDNKNPQVSDGNGTYGFMVFHQTDYYLTATKNGYYNYVSPTISVEEEIVKWDLRMNPESQSKIEGVQRLAGDTRIDTALSIAKAAYSSKVSNIVLVGSEAYADALSGSVLAYKSNAPMLLIGSTSEEQDKVINYMKSNMDSTGNVYLLGGQAVLSKSFEDKITAAGFNNVTRLGGSDRYETSQKIAEKLGVNEGTPVIIASGENYPDALSVSSVAAVNQYPILLVRKDEIPSIIKKEISAINPVKVFIIGLEGSISPALENNISADKSKIERIGGKDRCETSLEIGKYFKLTGSNVCIATGNNFADALAGSVYAAKYNASIILTDKAITDSNITFLKSKELKGVTVFGGESAVNKDVYEQFLKLLGK